MDVMVSKMASVSAPNCTPNAPDPCSRSCLRKTQDLSFTKGVMGEAFFS